MKLKSIQVFPNGKFGWDTDRLIFGESITQLYGPNGTGKTPLIQSIAYCLGYPCIFRNDIYEKCSHAVLEIETDKGELKITRKYLRKAGVEIDVTIKSLNISETYYDEKEFSLFIFSFLGIEVKNLLGNNNKVTFPYLATVLPIFYLDQDEGYNKYYSPAANFIKDQFSEMMRLLLGLPVKNSFDVKRNRIEAKDRLSYLDSLVHKHTKDLELAVDEAADISLSEDEILSEISKLEFQMKYLKSTGSSHDESVSAFDSLISGSGREISKLSSEISDINKRLRSVETIKAEIETEIETLNLNEEAKRIFLSFEEICSSENCELFSASSKSYSKSLLYLRDQMKDLDRNANTDIVRKEQYLGRISELESETDRLIHEKNSALEKSDIASLVDAISEVKNQVFELQGQLDTLRSISALEKRQFESIVKRNNALDAYNSLSDSHSSVPEIIKLRSELRELYVKWLDVLNTKNVNRDIYFKNDFEPVLGEETVMQLKGSTRTRAVLAYHASVLELLVKNDAAKFPFLILDTPKQHEVHSDDLNCFLIALKKMSDELSVQIIFSTTEYHYAIDRLDVEWNPSYQSRDQKMYFREPELR